MRPVTAWLFVMFMCALIGLVGIIHLAHRPDLSPVTIPCAPQQAAPVTVEALRAETKRAHDAYLRGYSDGFNRREQKP